MHREMHYQGKVEFFLSLHLVDTLARNKHTLGNEVLDIYQTLSFAIQFLPVAIGGVLIIEL